MADFILHVPSALSRPSNATLKSQPKIAVQANTKAARSLAKPLPPTLSPSSSSVSSYLPSVGILSSVTRAIHTANNTWLSWKDGLTDDERRASRTHEETKQILSLRMKNAETYAQWDEAANQLDILEGNDEWKRDDTPTGDYSPELIEERLRALDEARTNCDIRAMMHLLRTALSRDLGGMDNVDLYRHSYVGTKYLIERYVDSTLQTINAVVSQSRLDHGIEHRDLLEGVLFARQSFGRSALLLSGGATFGMAHIGVLKALHQANLLPRIISGASAGSIVCATLCTRTDEEIPQLLREFPYRNLAVFKPVESQDGVLENLRRLLTEGSWSDIKLLSSVMRDLMGDMTFQEAYNRTRRILNICVSSASVYELPRLLNYVTAPNVMIWSAVAASCSVPLVFNASPLLVKDPLTGEHLPWNPSPQRWIDGSVDNDLPMTRLAEMFNVNHFIVSQVNPHVVPFLAKDDHLSLEPRSERPAVAKGEGFDWAQTLTHLAKDEALHRLHFLAELGIMPNLVTKLRSILSQKYSGDINILPAISMNELPALLRNPTSDFMIRFCLTGERATWPKLSRIRDRCAIELALDRAVHQLRARVVFSESQRDLRRLNGGPRDFDLKMPRVAVTGVSESGSGTLDEPPPTQKRDRRRSGGSFHVVPDRWKLLDTTVTDDDTEQEERLEMRSRRSHSKSPVAARKPTLKRASRSHVHMRCSLTASAHELTGAGATNFDFSKPPTPPSNSGGTATPSSDDTQQRGRRDACDNGQPRLKREESSSIGAPVATGSDLLGDNLRDEMLSDSDPYEAR